MKKIKKVKVKREKEEKVKRRFNFKVLLPFIIIALAAAAVLAWALPQLPKKPQTAPPVGYKGIVELWNVETFEGGSGSRSTWITSKAAKFEKINKGLFVHVTDLTVSQLSEKLTAGESFDIICFSRGAGVIVKDKLAELDIDVGLFRENMAVSAQAEGKQYAVPLYAGAYGLFARKSQLAEEKLLSEALTATYTRKIGKNTVELKPLICGFTDYNSPLTALALSGGKGSASADETVTQYQAYEKFVANKTAVTLLGTQRDLYRLNKKQADGKIEDIGVFPLSGYTDLVQYLGISSNSGDKSDACLSFVKYLTSEEIQKSLVDLNMFSVLNESVYTAESYAAFEKTLEKAYVPNVFGDANSIANQRKTAIATLNMK